MQSMKMKSAASALARGRRPHLVSSPRSGHRRNRHYAPCASLLLRGLSQSIDAFASQSNNNNERRRDHLGPGRRNASALLQSPASFNSTKYHASFTTSSALHPIHKSHFSTTTTSTQESNNNINTISNNKSISILSKEAATAPVDYPTSQRFWALPPAIAIHLSIGSVYVYSMWTPGMSKTLGESIMWRNK